MVKTPEINDVTPNNITLGFIFNLFKTSIQNPSVLGLFQKGYTKQE